MLKLIKRIFNGCLRRLKIIYGKIQRAISLMYIRASGKKKHSMEMLLSLKGKYAGKRCFILGNGPSLSVQDVEMLENEVTFASNRIFNLFAFTEWRPTYYMVSDGWVAAAKDVQPWLNTVPCQMRFFIEQHFVMAYKKLAVTACFLRDITKKKHGEYVPHFESDLTKGICTVGTVTYVHMQLAAYMGFSEIYLLGCDHKYSVELHKDGTLTKNEGVKDYFGTGCTPVGVGRTWEASMAYEDAEQYSRAHGFRIYNATRGGYLEIFERKDLDEVLAHRENLQ